MHKLFLFIPAFFFGFILNAQDEVKPPNTLIYQRIDASYYFGAQVYDDNFIYNPGVGFQGVFGFLPKPEFGWGFLFGYNSFENERFIPIGLEVIGYKNSNPNCPFIKMQAGYSIGWYVSEVQQVGYNYGGGLFVDAGFGRKIHVKKNCSILFGISYRHQFAKAEYEIYGTQKYSENLNYDMIVISFSLYREP